MKLSVGKCHNKNCYQTDEDALVAASRRLRDFRKDDLDWKGFRTYRCPKCGFIHLTKERR